MTFECGVRGGGGGIWVISEKNILRTEFERKNLARKYLRYNGFLCQGKEFYPQRFGRKKFLRKPYSPSRVKWSPLTKYIVYSECRCKERQRQTFIFPNL